MSYEKGPVTAVGVLAVGIVDLIISPILFVLSWIVRAVLLPVNFLTEFFDFSNP